MGIDVRIWIKAEDLKKLYLCEAVDLYNDFRGRWQYCISDRFVFEESGNKLTLKEIKDHIAFNSDVSQKARDIIRRLGDLDIIFQMDCESEEPEGYFDLIWFMYKYWDLAREEIK